jgi:hypothetical protein
MKENSADQPTPAPMGTMGDVNQFVRDLMNTIEPTEIFKNLHQPEENNPLFQFLKERMSEDEARFGLSILQQQIPVGFEPTAALFGNHSPDCPNRPENIIHAFAVSPTRPVRTSPLAVINIEIGDVNLNVSSQPGASPLANFISSGIGGMLGGMFGNRFGIVDDDDDRDDDDRDDDADADNDAGEANEFDDYTHRHISDPEVDDFVPRIPPAGGGLFNLEANRDLRPAQVEVEERAAA